jgi:hypothetical protein
MKSMCYFLLWLKCFFWLGVNQTSNQNGQTKEKVMSKWPWLSQIGHIDLTLTKQALAKGKLPMYLTYLTSLLVRLSYLTSIISSLLIKLRYLLPN